jgi:hypothetical protein
VAYDDAPGRGTWPVTSKGLSTVSGTQGPPLVITIDHTNGPVRVICCNAGRSARIRRRAVLW